MLSYQITKKNQAQRSWAQSTLHAESVCLPHKGATPRFHTQAGGGARPPPARFNVVANLGWRRAQQAGQLQTSMSLAS